MSNHPDDNSPEELQKTNSQTKARLGRRLFIFKASAILTVAAAASGTFGTARRAVAQKADNDPDDPFPGGTVTDRDPTDEQRRPRPRNQRPRGRPSTDRDPTDGRAVDNDPTD